MSRTSRTDSPGRVSPLGVGLAVSTTLAAALFGYAVVEHAGTDQVTTSAVGTVAGSSTSGGTSSGTSSTTTTTTGTAGSAPAVSSAGS